MSTNLKQVAVLGCGAWGTALVRLIADNVRDSSEFSHQVSFYVRDERDANSKEESLADIVNRTHFNPVYLPGMEIPTNVVATSDLLGIARQSDILIIAYPPNHVQWLVNQLRNHVRNGAIAVSFSKGFILSDKRPRIRLISDTIHQATGLPCVVVIGATQAVDVAHHEITEATVGTSNPELGALVKRLVQSPYFRLVVVRDEVGVELYGALKHIVAIAAGMVDGLGLGDNTKSAVLRLGFWEMTELMKELFPNRGTDKHTLEQSCGMAELFICMAHRNESVPLVGCDADLVNMVMGRRMSCAPRQSFTTDKELAALQGHYTSGAEYAKVIYEILKERNRTSHYPLFTAVHLICSKQLSPSDLIDQLRSHPVHR